MKLGWSAKMQKLDFIPMKVKLKIVMKSAANNRHNHADQVDIGCQYLRFFYLCGLSIVPFICTPEELIGDENG